MYYRFKSPFIKDLPVPDQLIHYMIIWKVNIVFFQDHTYSILKKTKSNSIHYKMIQSIHQRRILFIIILPSKKYNWLKTIIFLHPDLNLSFKM